MRSTTQRQAVKYALRSYTFKEKLGAQLCIGEWTQGERDWREGGKAGNKQIHFSFQFILGVPQLEKTLSLFLGKLHLEKKA